jgi:hypothetical protein
MVLLWGALTTTTRHKPHSARREACRNSACTLSEVSIGLAMDVWSCWDAA